MAEIKFISENRDMLIEKIDFMQNKFTSLVGEITDELRDSVTMFSERINNKLKHIENKFSVQQEELENLKKELKSKQFDESNFNNVSMIKNQSKQIAEKELKIKELENRIRLLEGNSNNSNNNKSNNKTFIIKSEIGNVSKLNTIENETDNKTDNKISLPEVANDDIEIEVSKDIIKTKGRIIKKKIIEVDVVENETKTKTDSVENIKTVKKITKKPINKEVEEEKEAQKEAQKDKEERIRLENEIIERQQIEDEEELKLSEEADAHRIAEEESKTKSKISKKTSETADKFVSSSDKKTTEKKPIKKKIGKEIGDEKPVPKVVAKITEQVQKQEQNRQVVFPDCPPNDEDLEILELDGADYYKDTTNNNVYQIINGDDRGIFLGIYDENNNTIISP